MEKEIIWIVALSIVVVATFAVLMVVDLIEELRQQRRATNAAWEQAWRRRKL